MLKGSYTEEKYCGYIEKKKCLYVDEDSKDEVKILSLRVPGGKVNILGGHSIGHSKQKTLYEHVSCSERFPR